MKRPVILHVTPQLIEGGAAGALVNAVNAARPYSAFEQQVLSLLPPTSAFREQVRKAGLEVFAAPDPALRWRLVAEADIVQIHYWNHPALYEFMRGELPPARILVWTHIAGGTPPQIITPQLVDFADLLLTTTRFSNNLPVFKNLPDTVTRAKTGTAMAGADLTQLDKIKPCPHTSFNIGYIGTVEFVKMNPHFVALSGQARIPHVKFIVCGTGGAFATLQKQAEELGIVDRFELRGHVKDIAPVLEILDVFGYPLCADNYATAELVLQEAMVAGIPPVVLSYGAVPFIVHDNETGLVVQNEAEYGRALEFLYYHPEERAHLGRNARSYAQEHFGADKTAMELNGAYESLLKSPKRTRRYEPRVQSGAEVFVNSLGGAAPQFRKSMLAREDEVQLAADREIAAASPLLAGRNTGGVLDYRNFYRNDAYLRLWSGLVLAANRQYALAVAEFSAARRLGLNQKRVQKYLSEAARQIGAEELAAAAFETKGSEINPRARAL